MKVDLRNFNTSIKLKNSKEIVSFLVQDLKKLNIVIILCPLFKKGELRESTLLSGNQISIRSSRINSKWLETTALINLLSKKCEEKKVVLHIDFLFADNGIPIRSFNNKDTDSLREHELIWRREIETFLKRTNVSFSLSRFSDIAPEVPRFINICRSEFLSQNPITHGNDNKIKFIDRVNEQLELWFKDCPDFPTVVVNRKNKKRISRLQGVFDLDSAFVMCTTYLGKRFRLPKKFCNSVFIWFERMDVLLTIDDMLDEFNDVKKVMIKV